MAEAAAVVAAKGIVSGLSSIATEQIKLAWSFEDELKRLQDSLALIQDVLHDAEDRRGRETAVRRWLLKLKTVAYDADDVLDELVYEDLRREMVTNQSMCSFVWKKVCDFFTLSNPVLFHFMMANEVKQINDSLDKIKNEGFVLGLTNRSVGRITELSQDMYDTDSFLEPVIGRQDDVSKLVNMLSSLRNQHEICVIPIVGMPGLGKATLARMVRKEVKEKKIFDVAIWVCVSNDFSHQKILGEMLQSLDRSAGGMTNIDAILQNLQKELKDKSFLLILDGAWNEDCQKWRELKNRLSKINYNANESSLRKRDKANAIVVTTCSQNIASIVATSPAHTYHLRELSEEECWSIIKERALGKEGAFISADREEIGKEIAKRCGGVPLLASVLGGILHSTRTKEEWLAIQNSNVWNLENNDELLPKLKLSFDNLPFYLKQCFAYCSIFPKGHVIEKDELIQLWMAQGFLHSFEGIRWSKEGGVTELEDVGDKFFNGLLSNSLFQDVERDTCGNIKTCKMHAVVHDLAQFVSKSELVASKLTTDISDHVRHMNVAYDEELVPKISKDVARKLRSLFSKVNVFNDALRDFKSLRILNFCDAMISDLPTFLGRFMHLRYLDVSGTSIAELPQSIDTLYNLQTLRFLHCRHLEMLPKGMRNLVSLRYIYFSDEKHMPVQIGCLTSLRTLPLFVVGKKNGCQIKELRCLDHLRGELKICKLENVKDREEARGAYLQGKTNINKLIYEWSSETKSFKDDKQVAKGSACLAWSYSIFNYDEETLDDLRSYSSGHSFMDEGLDDSSESEDLSNVEPEEAPYELDECKGFDNVELEAAWYDLNGSEGFNQDEVTHEFDGSVENTVSCIRSDWSYIYNRFDDDEVSEGLEPPKSLQSLSIKNFNEDEVSEGLEPPKSLQSLSIKNFNDDEVLEGLEPPKSLQSLSIKNQGQELSIVDLDEEHQ